MPTLPTRTLIASALAGCCTTALAQDAHIVVAAFTSGGFSSSGVVLALGQPFAGHLSTGTITADIGIVSALLGPTSCLGDIADDFGFTVNEGGGPDGVVDFGDFVALLGLIGPCPGGVPGCLGDIADDFGFTAADGGGPDGQIDFGDFVALLGLIGPCP